MRLENKVAIITGATGGIGEATAKRFLREGASLMLVGRSADKLAATVERLDGGDSVAHSVADAADEQANAAAIAACVEQFMAGWTSCWPMPVEHRGHRAAARIWKRNPLTISKRCCAVDNQRAGCLVEQRRGRQPRKNPATARRHPYDR